MRKKITQIVIQKKRKNRCSIFLDDEFAFGLNEDVVLHYGLKKGDVLTEKHIEDILFAEEKKAAKDRAVNFLSYRDRSEKEMRTKLRQVGFEENFIEDTIVELKRLQLLDDEKFAMSFARSKLLSKPMGEFLLKQELRHKGIEDDVINQTIEAIYSENDPFQLALKIAERKLKSIKNLEEAKKKKRVSDLLLRRGFNWDVVSQVLEMWDEIGVEDSKFK